MDTKAQVQNNDDAMRELSKRTVRRRVFNYTLEPIIVVPGGLSSRSVVPYSKNGC